MEEREEQCKRCVGRAKGGEQLWTAVLCFSDAKTPNSQSKAAPLDSKSVVLDATTFGVQRCGFGVQNRVLGWHRLCFCITRSQISIQSYVPCSVFEFCFHLRLFSFILLIQQLEQQKIMEMRGMIFCSSSSSSSSSGSSSSSSSSKQ